MKSLIEQESGMNFSFRCAGTGIDIRESISGTRFTDSEFISLPMGTATRVRGTRGGSRVSGLTCSETASVNRGSGITEF